MYSRRRGRSRIVLAERSVNIRFVAVEAAVLLAVVVLLAGARAYQLPRNAAFLKIKAAEAVEQSNIEDAARYLRLYLGLKAGDHEAYAQLATILAKSDNPDANYEAYEKLLQVLRREPSRYDLRIQLIELAIKIGENRQALEQADLLAGRVAEPQWWLPIARTYTLNEKLDKAVHAYRNYVEHRPTDLTAYREYAELEFQTTRDKELLEQRIQELLVQNKQSSDAYLMAYVMRRDHGLPNAIEALDEARRLAPDNVEVLLMAAGEAIRTRSNQASQFLETALKSHPNDLRVLFLYGKWVQGQGDVAKAVELFQKGFEASNGASAEFAWRTADLLIGRPGADLTPYLLVVRQNPQYRAVGDYLSGRVALVEGRLEEARDYLGRASKILESKWNKAALGDTGVELDYALALANAAVHLADGRLGEAVEEVTRATELFPDAAVPWMTLGFLYFQGGRYSQSVRCWREALRRPPIPPEAYFDVARSVLYAELRQVERPADLGDFERAYDVALRRIPNSPDLVSLRAEYLFHVGSDDEAMLMLEAGVQAHPRDYSMALSLLRGCLWTGRIEEGIAFGRATRRNLGVNAPLAVQLALLHVRNDQPEEAQRVLTRALEILPEPQKPFVVMALGDLAWNQGRRDEAATHFQKAAADAPTDETAQVNLFSFYLEDARLEEALALIESWKQAGDEAMALWAQTVLDVQIHGLEGVSRQELSNRSETLKRERPYWWGTAELAGLVEEERGRPQDARQHYVTAAWTGPAQPFLLRRLLPLLGEELTPNARLLLRTTLERRIPIPPEEAIRKALAAAAE